MRVLLWATSISLVLLIIVLSLVGTFHDDVFYRFAYERNGAYEKTDSEMPLLVTENFQSYLDDEEELLFFQDDQASHLEDVKGLYKVGVGVARVLIALLVILFVVLAYQKERSILVSTVFRNAAITLFVVIGVIALLSLRWEWFFTMFHELFFSGNWQFHPATLMLRLWGENFFPLAAGYVVLKSVVIGVFLFVTSKLISPLSVSR